MGKTTRSDHLPFCQGLRTQVSSHASIEIKLVPIVEYTTTQPIKWPIRAAEHPLNLSTRWIIYKAVQSLLKSRKDDEIVPCGFQSSGQELELRVHQVCAKVKKGTEVKEADIQEVWQRSIGLFLDDHNYEPFLDMLVRDGKLPSATSERRQMELAEAFIYVSFCLSFIHSQLVTITNRV